MYSFYGGKPGNSFVITKTYASKEEMLTDFNSNNCQVHYDEYVLINNTDKLNKEHGNIYRRAYGTDENAAVFIGNIAGPPGAAPKVEFKEYNDPIFNNVDEIKTGNFDLIQGNQSNQIKWKSTVIKNEDNEDSTVYLGIQIPYPMFTFHIASASPYQNGTAIRDTATIERITTDNPFQNEWKLYIPRGITGKSLKRVWIENNPQTHVREVKGTMIDYTEFEDGYEETVDLGDFGFINEIDHITKDGNVVHIYLTNGDDYHFDVTPTSTGAIHNFSFDANTGQLVINDGQNHSVYLELIKDLFINDNGDITIRYSNGVIRTHENQLRLPESITVTNTTNGQDIKVKWTNETNPQTIGTIKKSIADMRVSDTNHLLIKYTNSNDQIDLGSLSALMEYGAGEIGPFNWIGTAILNRVAQDNNILIFNLPLNKTISKNINNLFCSEGNLTSENNFINIENLNSNQLQHMEISKTENGLLFTISQIQDEIIFSNVQSDSDEEEITQITPGVYYININISNLILILSEVEQESSIQTETDQTNVEEENSPETNSQSEEQSEDNEG